MYEYFRDGTGRSRPLLQGMKLGFEIYRFGNLLLREYRPMDASFFLGIQAVLRIPNFDLLLRIKGWHVSDVEVFERIKEAMVR